MNFNERRVNLTVSCQRLALSDHVHEERLFLLHRRGEPLFLPVVDRLSYCSLLLCTLRFSFLLLCLGYPSGFSFESLSELRVCPPSVVEVSRISCDI